MKLAEHPTVKAYHESRTPGSDRPETLEAEWLKKLARDAGAADVGLVDLDRGAMAGYRQELLEVMPETRTVMVLAFGINPDALKSTAHSLADLEFKQRLTHANHVGREIVGRLKAHGVKSVNMPCGFPYEAKAWPAKMWLTNDKVFAVEAGLGRMGWNRLLLHGKLGAAVLLGCVLVGAPCGGYDQPLGFNPCIECGLCVGVCPVGAVRQTDAFDFMACYAHNYRERLGGFQNWVERLADSRDGADYRRRVSDSETISMWQNLSIGAQTHCDRCMAVCPAGEEAIGGYLADRKAYSERTLKRFNRLPESVYVLKGSDAELHARSRFPEKTIRYTSGGIRPSSARLFLESLPLAFQSNQSEGLDAVYQFNFTGAERVEATVTIRDKRVDVQDGLIGRADLSITADSRTWVGFLAKEKSLFAALATRKIKMKGDLKLMKRFARCFPA